MADKREKTLKITFSGICTLWPGPPRDGKNTADQAFVIMPANMKSTAGRQTNDWDAPIPDHFPFVHVASTALVDAPPPDEVVVECAGGEHFVYFFQNARVAIDPSPSSMGIKYYFDPKGRPLAERPGSDDVAEQDDIRWLADIRDIFPNPPPLKRSADPTGTSIGDEVAAIVNLDAGTLKANFPADSVNPKIFKDVNGNVVPGLQRVLADEFVIEIPYPAETERVTLLFKAFRQGTPVAGPPQLVLQWPKREAILELRMGNDPKDETSRLDTDGRFDPLRRVGPVLKPRDDDFDLHYNLLNIPKGKRLLPQNDIQQCQAEGCKPKTG